MSLVIFDGKNLSDELTNVASKGKALGWGSDDIISRLGAILSSSPAKFARIIQAASALEQAVSSPKWSTVHKLHEYQALREALYERVEMKAGAVPILSPIESRGKPPGASEGGC